MASDIRFVQLLKQAEVSACAYSYLTSNLLGVPIREISLVGYNREPLAKAFIEFERWAASGGGDAVELTFIFLKDGGYLLSIGREPTRATRDLKGSDRTHSPILLGATYLKKFDTRQPALEELREYKRKFLISPFLFGAGSIDSGIGARPSLSAIKPLEEATPLLKFEAEFLDEDAILPGDVHHSWLTMSNSGVPRKEGKKTALSSWPEPRQQQPEDYFRHRMLMLDRHFPVTIERIRAGRYSALMNELRSQGIKDWQLEQAACNLLLSASLCDGQPFYPNLGSEQFVNRISQAIEEREERSDTPEVTQLLTKDVIAQVQLDAMALLRAKGQPLLSSTLESLQEKLALLNLLEPQNA